MDTIGKAALLKYERIDLPAHLDLVVAVVDLVVEVASAVDLAHVEVDLAAEVVLEEASLLVEDSEVVRQALVDLLVAMTEELVQFLQYQMRLPTMPPLVQTEARPSMFAT